MGGAGLAARSTSVRVGDVVADRFVLERVAGSGGMGTVYRARDRHADAFVAVKVMNSSAGEPAPQPGEVARFVREAEILAEMSHPAIVRHVAHGVTGSGLHFLVMEWLEGEDLCARLARGRLRVDQTLALARRLADALAVAHAQGVVHRDLKPSNVFLPDAAIERAKILDFGQARATRSLHAFTRTGALVGTPGYMAPEQVRGEPVGPSADVFALGCVLFECLTGEALFQGEHVFAVLAALLLDRQPSVAALAPDVPAAFEALIGRMLAKDAAQRPRDGAALRTELEDEGVESACRAGGGSVLSREGLTSTEQRVTCVVVAGAVAHTARTLSVNEDAALHRSLQAAAEAHGCRLHTVSHDALLVLPAIAGAPVDQASCVARSALALRRINPDVPYAVATGRAVMVMRMPIGALIDAAVADALRTPAGSIRLDDATTSLLGERFVVEGTPGDRILRDERERSVPPTWAAGRTLLGRAMPCVGRDRELRALDDTFDDTAATRSASAVLITGEAGAGKSRVRHEFLRRIEERRPDALVLVGRAEPVGAGAPFAMIGALVRRAAGILGDEPHATRRTKLRELVAKHVPVGELDGLVPALGELAGVQAPEPIAEGLPADRGVSGARGDAMRAAWQHWLSRCSDDRPVILVLEDLHWGDLPTVSFVDTALRTLRDRPLMVLGLARPDVDERFPGLWNDRRLQVMRLGRLTRAACEKLVRASIGETLSADDVTLIAERCDGNAFYLEELIRACSEGGLGALPDTVLGMLQARLDTLDPAARRVLRAASVFGRTFWSGGVRALLGDDVHTSSLDEWLAHLHTSELVSRRLDATFEGETELGFRHVLLREAVYGTLTAEDRALGHRLAGDWLERVGASDASVVAEHFDLGGAPARAIGHHVRAAEQALQGADLTAALAHAKRGIACGAQDVELGALRLVEAEVHRWRGEFELAEQVAAHAASVLRPGSTMWFRALGEVTVCAGRVAALSRLTEWAARAMGAEAEPGALGAQVVCLCDAARPAFNAGRADVGHALVARIEEIVSDAALPAGAEAQVWRLRGGHARLAGDDAAAARHYELALDAFERAGDLRNACNGRASLAFSCLSLGCLERAEELLDQSLAVAQRMDLAPVVGRCLHNLGLVYSLTGRHDLARITEEKTLCADLALGDARFLGFSRIYLCSIAYRAGDFPTAVREARRALPLLEGFLAARTGALAWLARALIARGNAVSRALVLARAASEHHAAVGHLDEFDALVPLALAEAYRACGDARLTREAARDARARLIARAVRIEDHELRESFLMRVPEHVSTLRLAEAVGATS